MIEPTKLLQRRYALTNITPKWTALVRGKQSLGKTPGLFSTDRYYFLVLIVSRADAAAAQMITILTRVFFTGAAQSKRAPKLVHIENGRAVIASGA